MSMLMIEQLTMVTSLMESNAKINFYNFPHDFDHNNNYFRDLLNLASKQVSIETPIDIYGCYPEMSLLKKSLLFAKSRWSDSSMTSWLNHQQGLVKPYNPSAFNIWSSFENRRPPHDDFDLTFTYELDDFNGTNYYLPLFYLYMNIGDINAKPWKHKLRPADCLNSRNFDEQFFAKKDGFVSSFINNPHPTRLRAISELSKIGKVNVYGRSVGNYVEDKIGTAGKYWFNLCFENDLYPGWVTEKVLEAWIAGTVPLYWGLDSAGILNPKAIVNLNDFKSLKDFLVYVKFLAENPQEMIEIINQPLILKDFNYEAPLEFLVRGLKNRVS